MKLALFDFDGTLFPLETIPFLVQEYGKYKKKKYRVLNFYGKTLLKLGQYKIMQKIDKVTFRKFAVLYFLELFDGESKEMVGEFFQQVGTIINELLDPVILNEIHKAKSAGYHTVILSGCFVELLDILAPNIPVDQVLGTEIIYSQNSTGNRIYRHGVAIDIIADERKVLAVQEAFPTADWEASCAYADSCYDELILSLVGTKIAVNPDKKLEKIATMRQWKILKTN